MVLVGNKADMREQRVVKEIEAQEIAKSLNIPYIETSAKTGMSMLALLIRLLSQCRHRSGIQCCG